jgi:fibro-slime domain-containing protein
MEKQTIMRAAVAAAVALGVTAFFLLKPGPVPISADPPPSDAVQLKGIVRDFRRSHADFNIVPSEGYGHYAGCIAMQLGDDGRPVFVGQIADTTTITNFQITQGGVVATEPFAAMFTLLGAAIETTNYHVPVTMRVHVGNQTFETFGPFENAVAGNVNDDQSATGHANPGSNPRRYVFPTIFPASTSITITGRSWERLSGADGDNAGDWRENMTHNSHIQSQQVRVLRDGDPVPNIAGFNDQTSIEGYVREFVNLQDHTIRLLDNQAIYLFEVGTTDLTSAAADFQDLVVLVTLARDPAYLQTLDVFGHEIAGHNFAGSGYKVRSQWRDRASRPIAPHLYHDPADGSVHDACGTAIADSAGERGAVSTGGIDSALSFDQWYRDELGVNLSASHTITLIRGSDGVYEYSTDAFHPIDGNLMGNEGDAHNHHFTYAITAQFVYKACDHQFFEFAGADDTWLFVDGNLVMDRGGVLPGSSQYVDMDRLGLVDGQTYEFAFFHAQRQSQQADFHVRTNIFMGAQNPINVSGGYD